MPILTSASGLSSEFAFTYILFSNGFFVGHLRFAYICLNFDSLKHALNNNFKVKLAHPGNNRLPCFTINMYFKRWIFLG